MTIESLARRVVRQWHEIERLRRELALAATRLDTIASWLRFDYDGAIADVKAVEAMAEATRKALEKESTDA